MSVTLNRRQLLRGTGLMAAAAAISPLMQGTASAAGPPFITAYGASVALGMGLAKGQRKNSTWFDQTRIALKVPGANSAYPGTTLFDTIERQAAPPIAGAPPRSTYGQFFWGGHSDVVKGAGRYVQPNLRTMVEKYPGSPYLILGLTNGSVGGNLVNDEEDAYYNEAIAPGGINTKLAREHGENFFDVQAFLVDLSANGAMALAGLTPSAADWQAINEYRVPDSLRNLNQKVHLNLIGQTQVAKRTTALTRHWFTGPRDH